jgi:hypothetical protein
MPIMSEAKPPTSLWNRPIKLNLGGFFTALGKAVVDGATGNWVELAKDTVDVGAAFGLTRGPEEQAGLLVSRALMRAVTDLIGPYRADFPAVLFPGPIDFGREVDAALNRMTITLDEQFLDHPRDLEIVAEFQALVEQWLGHVDLHGRSAKTIAARLPQHFVYALHRECLEHGVDYSGLFAAIRNEFSDAWRRERSWLEYEHWFASELGGPVFAEDFGLEQIFIWPRAYSIQSQANNRERHVVDLRERLDSWLSDNSREHAIRVISGDPGAGKSSFARMFAAHRMALGDRVLLVPLHALHVGIELTEAITTLCRNTRRYPAAPFETGDAPLLLILDGLDELAKQGYTGTQLALDFARHVQQAVTTHNLASLRLRVLLCGRPIAVQDVESGFRATGQVLHLLPYFVSSEARSGWVWIDPEGRLAADQRDTWWRNYGELTRRGHGGLPDELAGESLVETTCQPLLGYLLALVHRDALAQGKTFDRDVSRNEIYASLIASVHQRDCNKPASGLREITLDEFEALLEEMALAAWHENARVVSIAAVERLCEKSGLASRFREYVAASLTGVGQLFTAFYFRRQGTRAAGEGNFEFTHKSFAEYLVARRFVRELAFAAEELALRDASKSWRVQGKDEPALALDWLGVFGPSVITEDLLPYLNTEVGLRAKDSNIGGWQTALGRLIDWTLCEGTPCERANPPLRFIEMMRWARNSERALLVMLQACSNVTKAMIEIDWPSETACGEWLGRLSSRRGSSQLFLNRIAMRGQQLEGANLWKANLEYADLESADLENAILDHANLGHADLNHASLMSANLWGANLGHANLRNAIVQHSSVAGANLECAVLVGTNFQNTDLRNTDLRNTNLRDANLRDANLQDANLDGADLRASNITQEQLAQTRGTPAHLPDDPDDSSDDRSGA